MSTQVTWRQRLLGLVSLLVLAVLVVGLPVVLIATAGTTPVHWAGIQALLTTPDDGTLVLAAIRVIAWVVWGVLLAAILLEIFARLGGAHVPHLPGFSLPQSMARGLISAVILGFTLAPLAGTITADPAHAAVAITQEVDTQSPSALPQQTPQVAALAAEQPAAARTHTVAPGESLWSIARDELGDPHRYTELADLNRGLLGEHPGFLRPGWQIVLPSAPTEGATAVATQTVTVQPGDTLSAIAKKYLGDPTRYPEIADASRDIEQPGGHHLVNPNEIDAGWTVAIPHQNVPTAVAPPATTQLDPPVVPAPAPTTPPVVAAPTDSLPATSTTPSSEPAAATSTTPTPAAATGPRHGDRATGLDDLEIAPVRAAWGVGAILAAGVIGLLAARRRTQQRRRRPGQRLVIPGGPAGQTEQDLRATADTLSVEAVDTALRQLARDLAAQDRPLPTIRIARLTPTQLELYLATPASLPEPWTGTVDEAVWILELDNTTDLTGADVAAIPAPYPALIVIGHDPEDAHLLLDLEQVGALNIAGDDDRARAIIAALAVELATSRWADDLQVTLVGAFPELEDVLETGRIRYVPSIDKILDALAAQAAQDRAALAPAGDLAHARVQGVALDAWTPEIVLFAAQTTVDQRTRLDALLDELPRTAIAAVTTGIGVGEWGLNLTAGNAPDAAVLEPVGLQLRPQALPADQYAELLQLAAAASVDELTESATRDLPDEILDGAPTPHIAAAHQLPTSLFLDVRDELEEPDPSSVVRSSPDQSQAHRTEGGEVVPDLPAEADPEPPTPDTDQPATAGTVETLPVPAPRVLVLGPIDITGATGPVEPTKRARLLELATFLALHPGATHTQIDEAIWPGKRSQDNVNTRNTATSKLRRWLGENRAGEDYLPRHTSGGGYSLLPAVGTDLAAWDDLMGGDPLSAPTGSLDAALRLVRGRPFEGHRPRTYAWSEQVEQRLISEIVDAAYELARRRLMDGRWRAAEEALVVGLRVEPAQERLWRMRILAAHESRDQAAETEAIDRLLTITDQLECDLEPETNDLLAALKRPGAEFDQLLATAL